MREGLSDGVELISGVTALIFGGGVFCLAQAAVLQILISKIVSFVKVLNL